MTLAPRVARAALFVLAAAVARKRPGLRPVAASLGVLACLDIARGVGLPARVDVVAWVVWPLPAAWLAVRVWLERDGAPRARRHHRPSETQLGAVPKPLPTCKRDGGKADVVPEQAQAVRAAHAAHSTTVALAWLAYAAAVAYTPWRSPLLAPVYEVAIRAPHLVAVGLAGWAWMRSKGPLTHARAVAAVLAASGAVDAVAGALAGPWRLAAPLSWMTIAACAVVLVSAWRRAGQLPAPAASRRRP